MDRFSKYNPKAAFSFFLTEILLTIIVFNPIMLAVSFFSALVYKLKLEGRHALIYLFKFILPLVIFVALFNFVFSHYGMTVLFVFRDMNFTLESLFYGFTQGLLLGSVIMWFSCYSSVVTAERFIAVFGRIMPNTAIVFSMVLSFIPRLRKNAAEISDARQLINTENKLKKSIDNFSALITMTLEQSIETADSMKARGYNKGRSTYAKYRFCLKDLFLILFTVLTGILILVLKGLGRFDFLFDPIIKMQGFSVWAVIVFAVFSLIPVIIDFTEDMRWFYLKRKI